MSKYELYLETDNEFVQGFVSGFIQGALNGEVSLYGAEKNKHLYEFEADDERGDKIIEELIERYEDADDVLFKVNKV